MTWGLALCSASVATSCSATTPVRSLSRTAKHMSQSVLSETVSMIRLQSHWSKLTYGAEPVAGRTTRIKTCRADAISDASALRERVWAQSVAKRSIW